MCLALDEMCQDAREEGREEGFRSGISKRNQMIEKLIQEKMSDDFIMRVSDISSEELEMIKSQIV